MNIEGYKFEYLPGDAVDWWAPLAEIYTLPAVFRANQSHAELKVRQLKSIGYVDTLTYNKALSFFSRTVRRDITGLSPSQVANLCKAIFISKKNQSIVRFQLLIEELLEMAGCLNLEEGNFPIVFANIEKENTVRSLDYELYVERFFERKSTLLIANDRSMRASTVAKFIRREINRNIDFHEIEFIDGSSTP